MNADPRRLTAALLGADDALRADLLALALTHRSAGRENNERLEFLGDAALGLVMAEALWTRFPEADEGELSRRRAALVNQDSLAAVARELKLGEYLHLGPGELRTGGHARDSILADALEAIIGAVYADRGFAVVRAMLLRLFDGRLTQVAAREAIKDPKTRLQEWLQARRRPVPEYSVVEVSGAAHDQSFHVRCRLPDDGAEASGQGSSRRRAEQEAASAMLLKLDSATAT
ncbi:ribonuclease III [Thiohalocapsa sp. ML1]|jgi:ribonuclease III|uniref:ribonuclease III n=1 Tax=Thiohalocapsa sp. ML1 TaxID=1431688 RepID=UPI000732067A|nr:ribonuclease III [Thiohalocapsa sp. ML1]